MRWLEPEQTAPPVIEPLSLAAALTQCVLEADDDKARDVPGYIAAARSFIEESRGIRLVSQTVKFRADSFCGSSFHLPLAPVTAVTSIKYLDADGVEQTLDPTVYVTALYGLSPIVALAHGKTWPAHRCQLGSITITCTVGYPVTGAGADAVANIPAAIDQALKLIVGDWNANREQAAAGVISAIPMVAVDMLLTNFRGPYAA